MKFGCKMEHYKSRNNDFFHFTNPHDDRSELDDDDYDYDEQQYYDVDDDRSCDFNFHTYHRSPPANFQTSCVMDRNEALILQLDKTMKNISDKLQHTIEGIGTRISRLEEGTCKLDKYVEDVKNSEERYHGMTHRKLRQMQSILQEVQDGVLFVRDKHDIAETQLQLAKLQVSKRDKVTAAQTTQQQQQLLPAPQSSSHIPFTSFLNQLPSNGITLSQEVSYHPELSQSPEFTSQQYLFPPIQQSQTPHQNKPDLQFPHFTHSYQLNSFQGVVSPQNLYFLSHPSQETPNTSSYSLSHLMHVESDRNYNSEFHAKYMPEFASFPDIHRHGELRSLSEISNVKPVEFSRHPQQESRKSNYTRIPVAQSLPHALPTAIDLVDGSSSEENANAIPVDDIVDKVTAMGFRRDLVRACVRKLTTNGSPVDLNAVLDGMMKNK